MSDDDVVTASDHERFADWDAAFVLGALTPADRRRYEGHLEGCARCRDAVSELSGLPGLLGAVPLDHVDEHATPGEDLPADLLPRLHAEVSRRRTRRLRHGVLAGLAVAAVAVAALVLLWPSASPAPAPGSTPGARAGASSFALQAVTPNPLAVDVSLVSEPWGTRVDLTCRFAGDGGAPGPDRNYGYALYVTNRAGVTMAGPTWTYGPDTVAEPVGTSKWPADQIAVVEVRGDDGTVLLRATR